MAFGDQYLFNLGYRDAASLEELGMEGKVDPTTFNQMARSGYLDMVNAQNRLAILEQSGMQITPEQKAEMVGSYLDEGKRKRAEGLKLQYKDFKGIPESSFLAAASLGSEPAFEADGKKYFLTEDTASGQRLRAQEEESARRRGKPPQYSAPTYVYKTESGERFKGSILGNGGYKNMGGGGYGPQIQEHRAAKGKTPMGPQAGGYVRNRYGYFEKQKPTETQGTMTPEETAMLEKRAEQMRKELAGETQSQSLLKQPDTTAPQAIYSSYGSAYTNRTGVAPDYRRSDYWDNPYSTFGAPPLFSNYGTY